MSSSISSVLRYEEIADGLRTSIRSGVLLPGDRLPSLRAMRSRYGITQATVERAHALLEKEGLIVRSQRSGVFVAEPRKRPRSGVIGFCGLGFIESHSSPYWSPILAGVREAMREHDVQILLLEEDSRTGWDKVDGVLLNSAWSMDSWRHLPPGLPAVSLLLPASVMRDAHAGRKSAPEGRPKESCITSDDYGGARQAAAYLIAQGHTQLSYLHSHADKFIVPQRLAGYRDALAQAGLELPANAIRRMSSPTPKFDFIEAGRRNMQTWLAAGWRDLGCTAILAHNDGVAVGIIEALREAGLRVPRDVSVVGFDGTEIAEYSRPRLTTVKVPLREIGARATKNLLRQIESGDLTPQVEQLPAHLHIGDSVAPNV